MPKIISSLFVENTLTLFFNLTPYSLDQNLDRFLCKNEQREYTKKGLSFGSM